MAELNLPLLVEPSDLAPHLGKSELRIVDLNQAGVYARAHIPGAVWVDYGRIIAPHPPAAALLPSAEQLAEILGSIGLTPAHHVVAYDDEGNGRASRFLWTLDAIGHRGTSLVDGGLRAWLAERQPTESGVRPITPTRYPVHIVGEVIADKKYLLAHLNDPQIVLVDTRTPQEYDGTNKRALRAGHIPGAVNFNWTDAMDPARHLRLKDTTELKRTLEGLGVTPDKEVITYCQTHHRSSHTYVVLKILGYPRVRSYPGSWSEWG
ncbi:MAG TPA: sulfurtransferase, partial [Burkholderiales bacterium]|nr:sulfurtransferase [Burkholderiales bacterium]